MRFKPEDFAAGTRHLFLDESNKKRLYKLEMMLLFSDGCSDEYIEGLKIVIAEVKDLVVDDILLGVEEQ